MDITQIIGLFGALTAGVAYLPQVNHLIKEHCAAGISQKAYILWLIASLAMLINALAIRTPVFILLSSIQLIATALILFFSHKYRNTCTFHTHNNETKQAII